jgi:hypothetical protein
VSAKSDLPQVPDVLADAALIAGPTCAATGDVSLSTWHDLVRREIAPQPVIKQSRCTRWRLVDVRRFWIEFAERALADERVTQRAKRASIKASEPAAVEKAKATRKARVAARVQAARAIS